MANEKSTKEIIEGVESFINNLHAVSLGTNAIQASKIEGYGSGQSAFDQMKDDFGDLDLSLNIEASELKKQNAKLKKEVDNLEKKQAELMSIFGDDGKVSKGSVAYELVSNLQTEIKGLIKQRDDLENEVLSKQNELKDKIDLINEDIKFQELTGKLKIQRAQSDASKKVKIIEQFSDFLAETNSNMRLYTGVIIALVIIAGIAVYKSIPDLLSCFESYDGFIKSLGTKASTWQIINLAFGLLIVKLPWALVLSAIFTGLYRLLKGLLFTYEKINQDKRNMSAIYAVSGNISQSLNEYGLAVSNNFEWEDSPDEESDDVLIKISKENLDKKRESLKWNQIMNYFERMQQYKEDPVKDEDDNTKFESLVKLTSKAIDKFPTIK